MFIDPFCISRPDPTRQISDSTWSDPPFTNWTRSTYDDAKSWVFKLQY